MVAGTMIGASIFVQPSEVTGQIPSIAGGLAVWAVCGVLTLIGALVCAELSSRFTESGGVYVYLREAFGPWLGFLWGWSMFWSVHSGIIALIAMIFARYTAYFFPLGEAGQAAVAIAIIWVISIVNYIGVKHGSVLQALFTLGKLLAIAAILIVGVVWGGRLEEHFVVASDAGTTTVSDFLTALIAGLFTYGGWHMVTYNAEETVDARRTIPRALVIGTLIVTACYIAMNTVYLYVLPLDQVAASERVAADAADAVLGRGGGATMSAIVMFSTFGALSGIVLAGPRVYLAMSRDGVLFKWFGDLHPVFRTPHKAILAQAICASVLVATGTYQTLVTRVIYTEWIFFALMAIGLVMLRRRLGRAEYSIWGSPVIPAIFVIASFAIVVNQIRVKPAECAVGLGLVLLGLPVYGLWLRRPQGKP